MSNLTMVEQLNRPGMNRVRALIKAMGYDAEDLRRPRIGVHNTWSETSPGHIHLKAVTEAVKAGIWQAGGTPVEFGGFAQCPVDVGSGGMRYDTPTRDVIAAEVETCAQIHNFEGLVLISSCDKNVPGHLLAAARLDLPAIIVPGGPMLSGRFQGKDVIITDLDAETWACGVGRPRLNASEMDELEHAVCPTAGSCALLGTANTMQCLTEAVGLALPGSATAPAPTAQRLWFAKQSGRRIVELIRDGLRPSRIVTADALENMIKVLHAIGGSTNAVLHILALAQELDLGNRDHPGDDRAPLPRGGLHRQRPTERDLHHAGLRRGGRDSGSHVATGSPTASRQPDRHRANPGRERRRRRGAARRGHPSSGSARVPRRLGYSQRNSRNFRRRPANRGPGTRCRPIGARRASSIPWRTAWQDLEAGRVQAGEVVVLRYEGSRGGPGLTEVFKVVGYLNALGLSTSCALVTDGKISGFAKGPFICQVSPEAALGGPIALVRDGDPIAVDIPNRRLDLLVAPEELDSRRRAWRRPTPRVTKGLLSLYARLGEPPERGGGLPVRFEG